MSASQFNHNGRQNSFHQICTTTDCSLFDLLKLLDRGGKAGLPAGIVLILDETGRLKGTITDGDVRRALLKHRDLDFPITNLIRKDPVTFPDNYTINQILEELPKELEKRNRPSKKYLSKIILVDAQNRPTRIIDYHQLWEQKVATHRHLVVVGLGYVGLTMALALSDVGFLVTGIDTDPTKLEMLRKGESYIHERGIQELLREQLMHNFRVSSDLPEEGDVFIISVGTPVVNNGHQPEPSLSYLQHAVEMVSKRLKPGNLVVLRSTVPVGTCREFVLTELEKLSGLKCGIDFHLSFAPERTAEGQALKELRELPQVIGGFNEDSTEATVALFKELTHTIVRAESLEAAEMVKLINNSFRDYIFAFSNHVARIANKFNIDINAVIKAANKGYPRDRVPLPSPGVGGPCLTKDPFIFASVAEKYQLSGQPFQMARQINQEMHNLVVSNVLSLLQMVGKEPSISRILVCGLAFKGHPETGDLRNSSAVEIAQLFKGKVGEVFGYDPVASQEEIANLGLIPASIPSDFEHKDAVLFLNNHKSFEKINVFEMTRKLNATPIIYDGWGIFRAAEILNTKECIFAGLSFFKSSIKHTYESIGSHTR